MGELSGQNSESLCSTAVQEAQVYKVKADSLFRSMKYQEAVEWYSYAIEQQPTDEKIYANRSVAHARLKEFDLALADAEACVSSASRWPKGFLRKGQALRGLRRWTDAKATFEMGRSLDESHAIDWEAEMSRIITEQDEFERASREETALREAADSETVAETNELFRIVNIPDCGLGAIAQQDIAQGSVIVEDQPLLVVHGAELGITDMTIFDAVCKENLQVFYNHRSRLVREKFSKLSKQQQAQVLALHAKSLCARGRDVTSAVIEQLRRHEGTSGDGVEDIFREEVGSVKSVFDIFLTNCIPCDDDRAQGLYPVISRFNHSCLPNATFQWRKELGTNVVVATRDIAKGDEICVSYFKSVFQSRQERQKRTLVSWGFKCACSCCHRLTEEHEEHLSSLLKEQPAMLETFLDDNMFLREALQQNMRSDNNRKALGLMKDEFANVPGLAEGRRMLQEMRTLYTEEKILPNLVIEEVLLHDRMLLEIAYGTKETTEAARDDYVRVVELLRGSQNSTVLALRCK